MVDIQNSFFYWGVIAHKRFVLCGHKLYNRDIRYQETQTVTSCDHPLFLPLVPIARKWKVIWLPGFKPVIIILLAYNLVSPYVNREKILFPEVFILKALEISFFSRFYIRSTVGIIDYYFGCQNYERRWKLILPPVGCQYLSLGDYCTRSELELT